MSDARQESQSIVRAMAMLIGAEPFQMAGYYRVLKEVLGYSDEKLKGAPTEKVLHDLGKALGERGYALDVRPVAD